jgi:hypothetical protein
LNGRFRRSSCMASPAAKGGWGGGRRELQA